MVDRFNIRYRKNNDIIYRKVAGEAMLLPISQKVGEIPQQSIHPQRDGSIRLGDAGRRAHPGGYLHTDGG